MLTLIGFYLLGIALSSVFINLCEYIFYGDDVTLGDIIHPYHLLSWILIFAYIGLIINDYIYKEDNFIGRFINWAKSKKILKK